MTNYILLALDALALPFFGSRRYWNPNWLIFTFIIAASQVLYIKGYR